MLSSLTHRSALIALSTGLLALATPADAQIFTYTQTNGDVLTIDSGRGTGTLTGNNISANFTGQSLTGFTGGATPTGTFALTSVGGTRTINGTLLTSNAIHPQQLIFGANGSTNLWTNWGAGGQYGDYVTTIGSYAPPPPPSTSGGSTSSGGGGGSSSGGATSVPEPEALGLFAAGVVGVALARRRRRVAK
ncbi:MAG: PEP-CTERM sorting domain-containing protein [Sphingomonadaceae bacterium]